MPVWTDDRKWMLVWRSGFQYRATISSPKPLDSVASIVQEFYVQRCAVLLDAPNLHLQTFGRGHERVGFFSLPRWSWSETQLRQTIEVSTGREGAAALVNVSYDVQDAHIFFGLIMAPNALVEEVRELRLLLETK